MPVYTLYKKNNTGEMHLFKGEITDPPPKLACSVSEKSICKKMDRSEKASTEFACQDEDAARKACANKGRIVCGTCVSHLYADY
jgi:hypothetical protein